MCHLTMGMRPDSVSLEYIFCPCTDIIEYTYTTLMGWPVTIIVYVVLSYDWQGSGFVYTSLTTRKSNLLCCDVRTATTSLVNRNFSAPLKSYEIAVEYAVHHGPKCHYVVGT